jgi:MFS transporter, OFA family, oxalate/formate antiporter
MTEERVDSRWLVAAMGTALQLCLGTVYAWSYFQNPLVEEYGWSNGQVAWVFSLAICFLGLAAAWGGLQLPRFGPRKLAVTGGLLFGAGYLLAALALRQRSLLLLDLGYGVLGGVGLGLGYVTPVATVAKWFPDKKGLATGMVIMGFGFGALVMSKVIAPHLCAWAAGDLPLVFAWLGAGFMVLTIVAAWFLRNPPAGWSPPEYVEAEDAVGGMPSRREATSRHVVRDLLSARFAMMWTVFFCNILAGISMISFQSPLFQDLWRRIEPGLSTEVLAAYGATLIAVSSLFNGVGRMLWGGLSDRIGRVPAFRTMLATQVAAFLILTRLENPWLFAAGICYVLLCYGGGFGTMPSFVLDVFGRDRMAVVYGSILTAWSAAALVGPQLVAWFKDRFPQEAAVYSFYLSAAFLAVGLGLTFGLPRFVQEGAREESP